jgi:DNA repair protein RadC
VKSDGYSIKDWPEEERPRERLIKLGGSVLSDAQLLSVIIGSGDSGTKRNAVDLCRDLIKNFGGFNQIDGASVNELCSVQGIGEAKAAQIKAAFELGKRLISQ